MAIDLRLTSAAPPDAVLAAIREDAREWRESVIPRNVWDRGVLQVVADVRPPKFRLRYDRRWQRSGGEPLALEGQVQSDGAGGSVVVARCGARGPGRWGAALFAAFALNNLVTGGGTAWWGFALVAALCLGIDWWNDGGVDRSDPEAAYLVERLEQAVHAAALTPGHPTLRCR